MSHEHHGHSGGGHAHETGERRIMVAAVLTGAFMLAEVAGGILSGSLALLADAGHMLVDFAGLSLALLAHRIARRPADARNTYGYDRFQILVAYTNGLALFAVTGWIVFEAWKRLSEPVEVLGGTMLAVAVGGLLVNIVGFLVLHGGDKQDLNLRGALLHVAGDLLGSLAAILAAIAILWTGWTPIDPILSVVVSLLILVNAWRLVREAGHILLEGAPTGVETTTVGPHLLASVPGVRDVHHLHVWALTPKRTAATLHVRIADTADGTTIVRAVKAELAKRFAIAHATVEVERDSCADANETCEGTGTCAVALPSHGGAGHDHGAHHHHHHHSSVTALAIGAAPRLA